MLRLVLLVLWVYCAKRAARQLLRTFLYDGVTAILNEVLLLRAGTGSLSRYVTVDVAHGSEWLGLFMIILLGDRRVCRQPAQAQPGSSQTSEVFGSITRCGAIIGVATFGSCQRHGDEF